jgi:hypothetical protein
LFLTIFNNKELTTVLHQMLVFLDRKFADYRGCMNQVLLYQTIFEASTIRGFRPTSLMVYAEAG